MFRKLLAVIAGLMLLVNMAWAAVDANTATKEELDGVKGIGPSIAQRIVDERKANGPFKSLADLQGRVKGVGDKTLQTMTAGGLTVGGAGAAKADRKSESKAEKKGEKAEKAEAKAEKKPADKPADKPAAAASAASARK